MPEQFRAYNYTVLGGGKTFHYDHPPYFDDTGKKGSWSSGAPKTTTAFFLSSVWLSNMTEAPF